ncbi:MAG: winged helix-turn-helix domain-containing protein [Chloroflexota bacterium]
MSVWDIYPETYREKEVQAITWAVRAGECVSLIGLSGAGKSNLMGFLAYRSVLPQPMLIDCNRLAQPTAEAFFRLVRQGLGDAAEVNDELRALEAAIDRRMAGNTALCLLLDRFDALPTALLPTISSNLRALRDAHKYQLTYVIATRRPIEPRSELAELFYAHNLWLGPLSESDARWNVTRYARRIGAAWDDEATQALIRLTWGYPSLLRAACEAYADLAALAEGTPLDPGALQQHPAIRHRVDEFWADAPAEDDVRASGLSGHPLLSSAQTTATPTATTDDGQLTAKEHLLLEHFYAHPNQVCGKDELIRAVWPEDRVYQRGIRDDSLAQLIRRLRQKIESDASDPQHILTVPGRGYRFIP